MWLKWFNNFLILGQLVLAPLNVVWSVVSLYSSWSWKKRLVSAQYQSRMEQQILTLLHGKPPSILKILRRFSSLQITLFTLYKNVCRNGGIQTLDLPGPKLMWRSPFYGTCLSPYALLISQFSSMLAYKVACLKKDYVCNQLNIVNNFFYLLFKLGPGF